MAEEPNLSAFWKEILREARKDYEKDQKKKRERSLERHKRWEQELNNKNILNVPSFDNILNQNYIIPPSSSIFASAATSCERNDDQCNARSILPNIKLPQSVEDYVNELLKPYVVMQLMKSPRARFSKPGKPNNKSGPNTSV